jgi:hypothetical protein
VGSFDEFLRGRVLVAKNMNPIKFLAGEFRKINFLNFSTKNEGKFHEKFLLEKIFTLH